MSDCSSGANITVNGISCIEGGFIPNGDISGIGVRLSFYLQSLFLALLSVRSRKPDEIASAVYQLVVTNVAYAVTSLILGYQGSSDIRISFKDGLVVMYLLLGSWATVCTTLAAYNRFKDGDKFLKFLTVLHSYVLFAFAFVVLSLASSFGTNPSAQCAGLAANSHFVLLRPFRVLPAGRIVILVLLSIVTALYSLMVYLDYFKLPNPKKIPNHIKTLQAKMAKHTNTGQQAAGLTSDANAGTPAAAGAAGGASPSVGTSAAASSGVGGGAAASASGTATGGTSGTSTGVGAPQNTQGTPSANQSLGPVSRGTNKKDDDKRKTKASASASNKNRSDQKDYDYYETGLDGTLIVEIIMIIIMWSLAVMNTELLLHWNGFPHVSKDAWQFGQVLALGLVLPPFVSVWQVFKELGLQKKPQVRAHIKARRTRAHMHGLGDDGFAGMGGFGGMGGMGGFGGFGGMGGGMGGRGGFGRRGPGMGMGDPFGGPGMSPLFGGMFGGGRSGRAGPYGNNASARISIHSVHDMDNDDEKQDDSDDVQDNVPDQGHATLEEMDDGDQQVTPEPPSASGSQNV